MSDEKDVAYVYQGKEVVLTGRTAVKQLRSNKEVTLYEIKPAEHADMSSTKYNSWVKMAELFKIEDGE